MRPLEESEIQQVFEKLFKFVGKNLKNIVDRADQPHCFRLHKKVRCRLSLVAPSKSSREWRLLFCFVFFLFLLEEEKTHPFIRVHFFWFGWR